MTQAPKRKSPWLSPDVVPRSLVTARFTLEPLHERHAEVDHAAFMSCRERLNAELGWGTWPPVGFTLEENREDLARHHGEFVRGEGFAFTVLAPDRTRCLGCIYVECYEEIDGAQLAFWVVDEALDAEEELVRKVLHWLHEEWPLDRVLIPLRETNPRGLALVERCGLEARSPDPNGPLTRHRCFLSTAERAD